MVWVLLLWVVLWVLLLLLLLRGRFVGVPHAPHGMGGNRPPGCVVWRGSGGGPSCMVWKHIRVEPS